MRAKTARVGRAHPVARRAVRRGTRAWRSINLAIAGLALLAGACTYIPEEDDPTTSTSVPATTLPTIVPSAAPGVERTDPLPGIRFALDELAVGFEDPVAVSGRSDTEDLYVGTRDGRVWRVRVMISRRGNRSTQRMSTPLLDLRPYLEEDGPLVNDLKTGELVDFIFSADARTMYVSTIGPGGELRVEAYPVGTGTRMDRSLRRGLLTVPASAAGRSGGGLAFGTDGFLFVGLGDGATDGTAVSSADGLGGSIVRLDPDVDGDGPAYAIPQGNPHATADDRRDEVWMSGLVSPDLVRIDEDTGGVWIGGLLAEDTRGLTVLGPELSRGRATEYQRLVDLGWLAIETTEGACGVAGLVPYRGDVLPELDGITVWASDCDNRLRTLVASGAEVAFARRHEEADLGGRATALGTDRKGEILVTTSEGRLFAVERATEPEPGEADG